MKNLIYQYHNQKIVFFDGVCVLCNRAVDFLLKKDPVYPGMSPYSTWYGYRYQGGFSDHLPVLLDLEVR